MSAEEDWDAWRERFDLTHNGIVRLFHDRAIWRSILSMLDSNPAVRRGGFGEYWLGSCYTNSQLIGMRRETDGDKDGVGLRRSLGQLAACPRIATRDWYERELRKEHAGRSASDLAWLSSGFDRFAAPGAPFIDSERVKEDIADLEVVITKVNEHTSKAIAHRDAAIARGQVAPIPVTWGQMDKALDRIGLVHAKYYRLCHPGESLGGLTPLVPPEWLMMFSTAWMTQNFVMPDHVDFEPEGLFGS